MVHGRSGFPTSTTSCAPSLIVPRLVFVVNSVSFFVSHRLAIADAAVGAGWDVHVIAPRRDNTKALLSTPISFHEVPFKRGGLGLGESGAAIVRTARLLSRLSPDVVHAITPKGILIGATAARLAGTRGLVLAFSGLGYAHTVRGLRGFLLRKVVQLVYWTVLGHKNLRVIVQNDDDLRVLRSIKRLPDSIVVRTKGSGVDLEQFSPVAAPQGLPLVILPARMLWSKGIAEFVAAAEILRRSGVSARFALVGEVDSESPDSVPVRSILRWQEAGFVEWWGYRADMAAVLREAAIVCLPSHREGSPKVLLEAAAVGRPAVTTDVPGCRDIVRPGISGVIVPARNADRLATSLRELIENVPMRERMGVEARRLAEEEFDVRTVVSLNMAAYRALIQ